MMDLDLDLDLDLAKAERWRAEGWQIGGDS
jgi:hypothetical protein